MTYRFSPDLLCQLVVVIRSRHDVIDIEISVPCEVRLRVLLQAFAHASVDRPIGRIDRRATKFVTPLHQPPAHPIALLDGVAFFKERIPETLLELRIAADEVLAPLRIRLKLSQGYLVGMKIEMRIRMIRQRMSFIVPRL